MAVISSRPIAPRQISTAPAGRGRRARPVVTVNPAYIRALLERSVLTARDETVLQTLDELGVCSTDQLARFYWQDPSTARHRLRKLYDLHLLDRSEYNPTKMVKFGLTPGVVYTLGRAGRLWLDLNTGHKERYITQPRQTLYHNLAVAELIVLLAEAARASANWGMVWQGEKSCRVVKQQEGKSRVLLEPDGWAGFRRTSDNTRLYYYLERDLSTENLAAFERKVRRYTLYCQSQQWQKEQGWTKFPGVIVAANSAERVKGLVETIQAVETPVIWVVGDWPTLAALNRAELLWAKVWTCVLPGKPPRQQALLPH